MSIAEKFETIADAVYEKGKKSQYDEFWDLITDYGQRINYSNAFFSWGGEYIRPYKKIMVKEINITYGVANIFGQAKKLKKIEKDYIDFSEISIPSHDLNKKHRQVFQGCIELEEIEDVKLPAADYYYTFQGCTKLHTIEVLRYEEDTETAYAFMGCSKLANITIDGTIGRSIDLKHSPLSMESVKNIITHLKDYSGTTTTKPVLTLKDTVKAELKADTETYNLAIAKGWEIG